MRGQEERNSPPPATKFVHPRRTHRALHPTCGTLAFTQNTIPLRCAQRWRHLRLAPQHEQEERTKMPVSLTQTPVVKICLSVSSIHPSARWSSMSAHRLDKDEDMCHRCSVQSRGLLALLVQPRVHPSCTQRISKIARKGAGEGRTGRRADR